MEIKEHILEETDCLFCRYGIKSVTMDDIAKHLGMSKKTIYQHFQDKDELVYVLISKRMQNQACVIEDTSMKAENAVHEIFLAVTQMQEMMSNLNPMLFHDLQKYHPEAWLVFKGFKEKNLLKTIKANIERGVREGFYRPDLNSELLSKMRMQQIDLCLSPEIFSGGNYSVVQVMTELTEHYMYGICNLNGHRLINTYKNIHED